jgi:hypothetical protein
MIVGRPELVQGQSPKIWMTSRREPKEIVDLALEPARRERARGQRREPGRGRVDRHEDAGSRPKRRGGKRVDEREGAGPLTCVGRGQELAVGAEGREPLGQRWDLRGGQAPVDLVGTVGGDVGRARLGERVSQRVQRADRHLTGPRSRRAARGRHRDREARQRREDQDQERKRDRRHRPGARRVGGHWTSWDAVEHGLGRTKQPAKGDEQEQESERRFHDRALGEPRAEDQHLAGEESEGRQAHEGHHRRQECRARARQRVQETAHGRDLR